MKTHINKEKNLEEALLAFRSALSGALIDEARQRGVSLSYFEVLKYIAEKGSPSMKDIAAQLHITPPSASALVEGLVGKGLVSRKESPTDRRTVRIELRPSAHVLLVSIHKERSSIFKKMLSRLDQKDKDELARILIKCI